MLGKRSSWAINIALFLFTLIISNYAVEYSTDILCQSIALYDFSIPLKYYLLSLATLAILFVFIFLICNRIWLSCMICSIACGIVAIINYFVIKYHSAPLSFLLLRNLKTALNVIDGYSFYVDKVIIRIFLCTALGAGASVLVGFFSNLPVYPRKKTVLRDVLLVLFCIAVIFFGYLSDHPVKPKKTISVRWDSAYMEYGFFPCTVETYLQMFNIVNKPEGYSVQKLEGISVPAQSEQDSQTPDIILILNETLYDLRVLGNIPTDVDYFEPFEHIDNCLRGYAISPRISSGTNNSEYEILTSNLLHLMPGVTPFQVLSLADANSIVSHLKALGYYTAALHAESPENYSRSVGYKGLGFDQIKFLEDFEDLEYYYNRRWPSDESVFHNMIRWYNDAPADIPRFEYVLTMQNHGGYEDNPPEYDLIHVQADYGENTELINEYLTYFYQSGLAFQELTEYYSTVDRPVIICMLGDHAPMFASDIADTSMSDEQYQLALRKVPLMIWANYPLEDRDLGAMSMNYVIPTLLDIADVSSSPYYRYLQQMHAQIPVLTSYDVYYDTHGNLFHYENNENAEYKELIDNYFYLEYNNLSDQRIQKFFDIP